MGKIKLIHLFSGVGSPEMALKRLNIPFDIVGYSEIDKFAVKSYKAIHNNDNNLGDVKEIKKLPKCNLLVYGSPCTDFSVAGLQKGLIDENGNQTRSGLLLEVERLLEIARNNNNLPEILLMENVKNLVGKKFKPDFDRWLSKLNELGYNNYWKILNAKDFEVPQNRERVFVISVKKEIDKNGYIFPKHIQLDKTIRDVLEEKVDEKYYLTDKIINKIQNSKFHQEQSRIQGDICQILLARDYKDPKCIEIKTGAIRGRYNKNGKVEQTLETNDRNISNTLTTVQKDNVVVENIKEIIEVGFYKYPNSDKKHQSNTIYSREGISPTLDTCSGGNRMPKITEETIKHTQIIRKLTPKECWRLMDFSDEDFEKAKNSGVSNSQLYKQAGNSIVVNVLYHIFKNMFNYIEIEGIKIPKESE